MTSFTITVSSQATGSQQSRKLLADPGNGEVGGVSQKNQSGIQTLSPTRSKPKIANATKLAIQIVSPIAPSTKRKHRVLSDTHHHNEGKGARGPRGLLLLSFPVKLHLMLERCESERSNRKNNTKSKRQKKGDENQDTDNNNIIIGWLSGGKAFKIYDKARFVKEIMPSYFLGHGGGSSFENFQRNLDLWGFTDMPCVEGPTTRRIHVCSHPSFIRDQPSACRTMRFRARLPFGSQNGCSNALGWDRPRIVNE